MIVDFTNGRVTTPAWQASFVDCSTATIACIEAPDRFLMAFPRNCSAASGPWSAAGRAFRMTAPAAHRAPPSGGYISDKYPHVHLSWSAGAGFDKWSRTAATPYDAGWSPGERLEAYRITYVGASAHFACTPD
ncbi:hypothetical protein [Caulobacter radicis]|uniref:hypothetical protein n=1 Tax=Caulobacter radicis TaxID=2172650 RepID=UPI001057EF2B|nr:hypothetical protein [Caulobacter radicis]